MHPALAAIGKIAFRRPAVIPTARPATRPSRPRRLGAWARLVPGLALCLLLVGCLGREAQAPTEATATAVEPAEASPEAAATEAGTGLGDYGEGDLISSARQLIFEGLRSGEGYFSADGRKLIYQAEREADNPFYQIYLLDLETGDNTLVSTGVGKTSCAWIHPDGDKVLFASTQDDPEAEAKMAEEFRLREEETGRRYEWNYDATFEIYQKDLATGEYTNLTNALGYDAVNLKFGIMSWTTDPDVRATVPFSEATDAHDSLGNRVLRRSKKSRVDHALRCAPGQRGA